MPWFTPAVKWALERRNRAHREAKRKNYSTLWSKFRLLRNRAVSMLRKAGEEDIPSLIISLQESETILEDVLCNQ